MRARAINVMSLPFALSAVWIPGQGTARREAPGFCVEVAVHDSVIGAS